MLARSSVSNSSSEIFVAIDGMGGDSAPRVPVEGSVLACQQHPNLHLRIYGDEQRIGELLVNAPDEVRARITIKHCPDVIAANDKPSTMIRRGKNTSMNRAIQAVHDGDCIGVTSAGNTGALMALSLFGLRCLEGIERPALGQAIPSLDNPTTILDLGANLQCSEWHLVQYAVMGVAFAEAALQLRNPRVALLNIGTEEIKGPTNVRRADTILGRSHLNYIGYVEGADLGMGKADVIVCDGFSGNIALKTAEGAFSLFAQSLKTALTSSSRARLGGYLVKDAVRKAFNRFDPILFEGAPLLGLRKTSVKAHGNTTAVGFCNAINMTLKMGENHLEESLSSHLAKLDEIPELTFDND